MFVEIFGKVGGGSIFADNKNFKVMITFLISIAAATMLNVTTATAENESIISESITTECSYSVETMSSSDQYLGTVNLCDPQGNICLSAKKAYKDSENGRIYIDFNPGSAYAQKSNNSNWDYMVRWGEKWYYFSF